MSLWSMRGLLAVFVSTAVAFALTYRSKLTVPASIAFFLGAFYTFLPVSICTAYSLTAQALTVLEFLLAAVASLGSLVAAASVSAVLPPAGIDTHGAGVALVHILFLEAGRAVYSFCRSRAVCRKLVPLSVEVSQWKAAATQNRPSSRFAEEVTTGSSSSSLRLFQAGNAAGLGFYVPVIITSVFPVWSGPAACCAAVTTLGPASAVDAFTVGLAVGTICIFNVFATLLVQKFFLRHATFKKHLCVLGATVVLHVIISSVAMLQRSEVRGSVASIALFLCLLLGGPYLLTRTQTPFGSRSEHSAESEAALPERTTHV